MTDRERIDATIQARIDREFAMSAATLTAKRKPKPKAATPKPKVKPTPKAKPSSKAKVKPVSKVKPASKVTAPKPATWAQAVAYIAKRDHCSLAVAGRKACNEFPGLHPANRGRKS